MPSSSRPKAGEITKPKPSVPFENLAFMVEKFIKGEPEFINDIKSHNQNAISKRIEGFDRLYRELGRKQSHDIYSRMATFYMAELLEKCPQTYIKHQSKKEERNITLEENRKTALKNYILFLHLAAKKPTTYMHRWGTFHVRTEPTDARFQQKIQEPLVTKSLTASAEVRKYEKKAMLAINRLIKELPDEQKRKKFITQELSKLMREGFLENLKDIINRYLNPNKEYSPPIAELIVNSNNTIFDIADIDIHREREHFQNLLKKKPKEKETTPRGCEEGSSRKGPPI